MEENTHQASNCHAAFILGQQSLLTAEDDSQHPEASLLGRVRQLEDKNCRGTLTGYMSNSPRLDTSLRRCGKTPATTISTRQENEVPHSMEETLYEFLLLELLS